MAESEFTECKELRTGEISLRLRTWAESIRDKRKDRYELLLQAADRLDDLEERIAIMTEPNVASDEQIVFPPEDTELN